MQHLERQSLPTRLARDLGDAAGVARNDDAGPGLADALDLPPGQLTRDLRLQDIVDARAAAAELAVRQLDQADAGNTAQERAGLAPHLLPVGKMAGIVIRDHGRQLRRGRSASASSSETARTRGAKASAPGTQWP